MIERALLLLERLLRRPAPARPVTHDRYPLQHWRVVHCCRPHDQEREH